MATLSRILLRPGRSRLRQDVHHPASPSLQCRQRTYRSMVPPSTCCRTIRIACRRIQLFLSFKSKSVMKRSQIGAVKLVKPSSRDVVVPVANPADASWPTRSSARRLTLAWPAKSFAWADRRSTTASSIDVVEVPRTSSMPDVRPR